MKWYLSALGLVICLVFGALLALRYEARQARIQAMVAEWSEDQFWQAYLHCYASGTPYFGIPCDEVGEAAELRGARGLK